MPQPFPTQAAAPPLPQPDLSRPPAFQSPVSASANDKHGPAHLMALFAKAKQQTAVDSISSHATLSNGGSHEAVGPGVKVPIPIPAQPQRLPPHLAAAMASISAKSEAPTIVAKNGVEAGAEAALLVGSLSLGTDVTARNISSLTNSVSGGGSRGGIPLLSSSHLTATFPLGPVPEAPSSSSFPDTPLTHLSLEAQLLAAGHRTASSLSQSTDRFGQPGPRPQQHSAGQMLTWQQQQLQPTWQHYPSAGHTPLSGSYGQPGAFMGGEQLFGSNGNSSIYTSPGPFFVSSMPPFQQQQQQPPPPPPKGYYDSQQQFGYFDSNQRR